ncbi:MAG: hypothetical protein GXY74_13640 [Phycisphaerae bacterium]|nr:hypothetical protein [Phycisphaerae bacterium]
MVDLLNNLRGRRRHPSQVVAIASDGASWRCEIVAASPDGTPQVRRRGDPAASLADALRSAVNGSAGNGAPMDAILLTSHFLLHRIVLPVPPATLPVGDELQQLVRWELEPRVAERFHHSADVHYCHRVLPSSGNGTREILAGALPADALPAWTRELTAHRLRLRGIYPLESPAVATDAAGPAADAGEPILEAARHYLCADERTPVLCVAPGPRAARRIVLTRQWLYALAGVACAAWLAFAWLRLEQDRAAWAVRLDLAGQAEAARTANEKLAAEIAAARRRIQLQQRLVPDYRLRPARVLDALAQRTPQGLVVQECCDEPDGRVIIRGWGPSIETNEAFRQALVAGGTCLRADPAEDTRRIETPDGRARYPFAYRCTVRGEGGAP